MFKSRGNREGEGTVHLADMHGWRVRSGLLLALAWAAFGQPGRHEYAVVLKDAPVAERVATRAELGGPAASDHMARIGKARHSLRMELARRKIPVTGEASLLLNAVFVTATREQAEGLRGLDGVRRVELQPALRLHLNKALDLMRVPQAWSLAGGVENAGAGVKIGVIDTGIDKDHPAFQDTALPMPSGFPKGRPEDLANTSNKVIVARSYVAQLPEPNAAPERSRPDDTTPRDRVGHGTAAAMIAAGRRVQGPVATITGVAPKAWLGNYKVFGSPGVNDSTRTAVLIQALEDAIRDGMDIVTLSLGSPSQYGPLATSQDCGPGNTGFNIPQSACDVRAYAIENAVGLGVAVVVSAGNDGDLAFEQFPTFNSIHTPGTAPSAITVGASTNAHVLFASVRVTGTGVPGELTSINALFGNGPRPNPPLTAPLTDVTTVQNDAFGCSPLANNTLAGSIALVKRGVCTFADKVRNAQRAGAVGVVIYQPEGIESIFSPASLAETGIPAALIGNSTGVALKNFVGVNRGRAVTMDAARSERPYDFPDEVSAFSSRGPATGTSAIKPELVAVGTSLYTATQSLDPNGDLHDPSGFTAAQGTSFSAPMVAGALAMVKQRNQGFVPGQLKSAVVNSAFEQVKDERGLLASILEVGAGKLDAAAAVETPATIEPATLNFGVITSLPVSLSLQITNTAAASTTFNLTAAARVNDPSAQITLNPSSVTLNAGQQTMIAVRLTGSVPRPGVYEGAVQVRSGSRTLRVPYLYLVGDGVPFNIFPTAGDGFAGTASSVDWLMAFKVIDQYGVAVSGVPLRFSVAKGGGSIASGDAATDVLGIAGAFVNLGATLGEQQFQAQAGGLVVDFFGRARLQPVIETGGVVDAASYTIGAGLAPGSYATIAGRGLSEALSIASTAELPLSLASVSVSFDAPAARLSVPGRLPFVSERQINVQIPWEFEGLNSVLMKVSIGPEVDDSSAVYELKLTKYSPALFEYDDTASGRRLAAAQDLKYATLSVANPASRNQAIQLYANGLGPVTNRPASGSPAQVDPLARTGDVTVKIGDRPAEVLFSGLAPGNVGLYQINVTVPADAPTGLQPVVVTIGGVSSKAVTLAVQ